MNSSDNNNNNGNDGFVWSGKATMAIGFLFALALAAARFAPILAAPLEWQHKSLAHHHLPAQTKDTIP